MKTKSEPKPAAPQPSPLPWRQTREMLNPNPRIMSANNELVAVISNGQAFSRHTDENTALIVRRVNQGPAFDALLHAAQEAYDDCYDSAWTQEQKDSFEREFPGSTSAILRAAQVRIGELEKEVGVTSERQILADKVKMYLDLSIAWQEKAEAAEARESALKAKLDELGKAERMGREDIAANRCGAGCVDCGSFYTMTGYGKPWHRPGCPAANGGKP